MPFQNLRVRILGLALGLLVFPWLLPGSSLCAQNLFLAAEQPAPLNHPYQQAYWPLWERVLKEERGRPSFSGTGMNFGRIDQNTWRNLVQYARECPEAETLHMVNGYFNQWRPKQDDEAWNTPEYWTTPREFMSQRGGDCEDYAIAKYFALRFLGFKADQMRVAIVRQRDFAGKSLPQLHAVLAVFRANTWFILDNNARPRDNVFPHTQYKGMFEPLYSVNENGAWVHGAATSYRSSVQPPR